MVAGKLFADNDLSFFNLSLGKMVASDADNTHGNTITANDRIIELESHLVAAAISLEGEKMKLHVWSNTSAFLRKNMTNKSEN